MNLKEHTACFTGGRPKSLYPTHAYAQFRRKDYDHMINNIYQHLVHLYDEYHIYRYISGGAQGFDQLAFQAVARLKQLHPDVENIVYIPFEHQESKWMEHGMFSQKEYRDMLAQADEIKICIPQLDPRTSEYRLVTRALYYRNECMCNDSSIVIGQYPDDTWISPATKGGTAACLRYASTIGIAMQIHDFRL